MSKCDDANSLVLQLQAECEVAAFLEAAAELPGACDRFLAADTWLREMDSLSWPANNHKEFFRTVSIRAISQIAANSYSALSPANPKGNRERHCLTVLHGGY